MSISHEEYLDSRREELLSIARGVLSGEVGVIFGSRKIQSFRFDLADGMDPDFLFFVGVDSVTDHLPVDEERRNWGEEALARKGVEIAEAEAFWRTDVFDACRRLIERFETFQFNN
ncbi:MAG: hypothetical protein AB7Q37_06925 [Pyrinomonadaceae bacterium]